MLHPESGCKVLLIHDTSASILACLRDNNPNIPYPGVWDLAGGGIEPNESMLDCAYREVAQELWLHVPLRMLYVQESVDTPGKQMGRACGTITDSDIGRIAFGDEGQVWRRFSAQQIATIPFVLQLRNFCLEQTLTLTRVKLLEPLAYT